MTSVSAIDQQIAELDARKELICGAQAEAGARLADAEATVGDEILDGNDGAIRELIELRVRVDGLTAALEALERRRATAVIDRKRAEAAELREQAASKRRALAELEDKTGKLLAKLSELENVSFDACVLNSQRVGVWSAPLAGEGLGPAPLAPWRGPDEVQRDPVTGRYAVPRSRILRDEIAALEAQAAAILAELEPPAPKGGPLTMYRGVVMPNE